MKEFYSIGQVASLLNISIKKIRQLEKDGFICSTRLSKTGYRNFNKKYIDNLLLDKNHFLNKNYLSTKEVAKLLGVNVDTINRWSKNGKIKFTTTKGGHKLFEEMYIKKFQKPSRIKIDQKLIFKFIKDYQNGILIKEISKKYKISKGTISKYLKLNNIHINKTPPNKLFVDETLFENINTEEEAYWLGFLSADGHLGRENSIALRLCETDIEHIIKYKNFLKSSHKIFSTKYFDERTNKFYKQVGLKFCSKKIFENLKKIGLNENKTLHLSPYTNIDVKLLNHYWRGFWDGDGGISFEKNSKQYMIYACGTKEMCEGFKNFIFNETNIKANINCATTNRKMPLYTIDYNGNNMAQLIIDLLYKNSTIFLNRKKIKTDKAKNFLNKRHKNINIFKIKEMIIFWKNKIGNFPSINDIINFTLPIELQMFENTKWSTINNRLYQQKYNLPKSSLLKLNKEIQDWLNNL